VPIEAFIDRPKPVFWWRVRLGVAEGTGVHSEA
jgi:hypothetical protein